MTQRPVSPQRAQRTPAKLSTGATRTGRAPRPTHRQEGGTTQAHGRTFAHATRHPGTAVVHQESAGPLGEAMRGKFPQNDAITQGWIGLALKDPVIRPQINFSSVGTGPELAICGYYLSRGFKTNGSAPSLFFQSKKFLLTDRSRIKLLKAFVVDVTVLSPWGGFIYLNVDGAFFHARNELEIFKDRARNFAEGQRGRAISVPDTVTYKAADWQAFVTREGIG